MGESEKVRSGSVTDPWLVAEGTLGGIRLGEEMLPGWSVEEHSVGRRNAVGKGDHSFLDSLRLGYSYQLYVGAVLLAHGLWVNLHPLSVRPDARAGREGSHSDEYDLLAGIHGKPHWTDDQYAEVEQRILRVSGLNPEGRVKALTKTCPVSALRSLSFSIEVKARGQRFLTRSDFPFNDLILEPESRYRSREATFPDVWACVSQVTGQVIWFPSSALDRSFVTKKGGRTYRTAPIQSFLTTEELCDYLALRNDDLALDDR